MNYGWPVVSSCVFFHHHMVKNNQMDIHRIILEQFISAVRQSQIKQQTTVESRNMYKMGSDARSS